MSFVRTRRLGRRTSFRLTLWYAALFIVSALALYALTYLLLSDSMIDKDRGIARAKIEQYAKIQRQQGLPGLLSELKSDARLNRQTGFFVRLADAENNTLFEVLPEGVEEIDAEQIQQVRITDRPHWFVLHLEENGQTLEIRSQGLARNLILQVGFGQYEREVLLEHFKRVFVLIVIPIVLLAVGAGFVLAHRALRPVRDLISAIDNIDTGRLDARVPLRESRDELDELVLRFNQMLAKIENLVTGMRESLANVAHDLRTPVTRLRMTVESMLASENDPESLHESILDCAEESERIVTILNTLMDVSEAETGTMALNPEPVNLRNLIDDAVELYQYVAEESGQVIETDAPSELEVSLDPGRIRQVLANLLDNAVKYSPPRSTIRVTAERRPGEVAVTIEDQGLGIPDQDLPRIFDRLYRGDKSRSHRGLGLGLSLVRAVAAAHGGRVEVDSAPGRGSAFTVVLPDPRPKGA